MDERGTTNGPARNRRRRAGGTAEIRRPDKQTATLRRMDKPAAILRTWGILRFRLWLVNLRLRVRPSPVHRSSVPRFPPFRSTERVSRLSQNWKSCQTSVLYFGARENYHECLSDEGSTQFKAQAVMPDGSFKEISLSDYRGKYVVLFFYPLDFTFVCPTEIIAFSDRVKDFASDNVQVLGVSVDSHFSHLAWRNTARAKGGIGEIEYPLVADLDKKIGQDYDVSLPGRNRPARSVPDRQERRRPPPGSQRPAVRPQRRRSPPPGQGAAVRRDAWRRLPGQLEGRQGRHEAGSPWQQKTSPARVRWEVARTIVVRGNIRADRYRPISDDVESRTR